MAELIGNLSRSGETSGTEGVSGGLQSRNDTPFSTLLVEHGTQILDQFMKCHFRQELSQSPPLPQVDGNALSDSLEKSASCLESVPVPGELRSKANPTSSDTTTGHTALRLSQLAVSFSQSRERKQVTELANTMDLDLSSDEFGAILTSMMSNSERDDESFVVAMFFCLDIGKRLLRSGLSPYTVILKICYKIMQTTLGARESRPRDDWEGTAV